MITPTLPAIADAAGAGPAVIGGLVATFFAGMLVGFALAAGVRRGRTRAVLAASLAVVALGVWGSSERRLGVYFAARTLMGLGSGGLWMGITFATLERSAGREYAGMAKVLAAYSAGSLIGPALGAVGGVRGPFAAYLALVAAGFVAALLLRPPAKRRAFHSDRAALRLPGFWLACAAELVAVSGLGLIEGVLPLHLSSALEQAQIAGLYVGLALLVAAGGARCGPRLAPGRDRRRDHPARGRHPHLGPDRSCLALGGCPGARGVGFGLADTGSVGLLLESVETERIVTAMIVWSQVGIAGYLVGPVAGGAVAETLSFDWIGIVPLAAAAALGAFALALRGREAPHPLDTKAAARWRGSAGCLACGGSLGCGRAPGRNVEKRPPSTAPLMA